MTSVEVGEACEPARNIPLFEQGHRTIGLILKPVAVDFRSLEIEREWNLGTHEHQRPPVNLFVVEMFRQKNHRRDADAAAYQYCVGSLSVWFEWSSDRADQAHFVAGFPAGE